MTATGTPSLFEERWRPRLLDLFCGAGGAAVGYHRAGFDVVGVDIAPQPHYPFAFVRGDALEVAARLLADSGFDAVHASPPCQAYTNLVKREYPDLIVPVRAELEESGLPWVIENVPGSPLHDPVQLCGSTFWLNLRRHRHFEANWPIEGLPCTHRWQTPRFRSLDHKMVKAGRLASVVGVHGHINYPGELDLRKRAMGIDWMTNSELVESIPPAYTEYIGRQLMQRVRDMAVAA